MKKHEKTRKNTSNSLLYVFIVFFTCLFFMLLLTFFNGKIFAKEEQEVTNNKEEIYYKNHNPIDLKKVLKENTSNEIKQEMIVEEIDLEYNTTYETNTDLPTGTVQVLQEGRVGRQNVVVIKKYKDSELISEEQVAENIIKAPVNRRVQIGNGNMRSFSSIKKGDKVYVVAETVAVRLENNDKSEKICTLNKNDVAEVLEISGDWLFISNSGITGYVPSDCVTTKNPKQEDIVIQNKGYSKQQLLDKLNSDMDLRNPSGFTLEQFKKVLSGDKNDKNSIFESNAEYFYYAEKQYNINGIFVASVGIHESGWGTSTISKNKMNLFGYGAVDSNPYGGSYTFNTYSEGIDMISRVFVKYYLNPPGTVIYDGTTTNGKYYTSSTLSGVNKKYASDQNWANSVYKWMQYLYNKL